MMNETKCKYEEKKKWWNLREKRIQYNFGIFVNKLYTYACTHTLSHTINLIKNLSFHQTFGMLLAHPSYAQHVLYNVHILSDITNTISYGNRLTNDACTHYDKGNKLASDYVDSVLHLPTSSVQIELMIKWFQSRCDPNNKLKESHSINPCNGTQSLFISLKIVLSLHIYLRKTITQMKQTKTHSYPMACSSIYIQIIII